MGDDGRIPDHVNDGVPLEEINRFERFLSALEAIAALDAIDNLGTDARIMMTNPSRIGELKREAFINAAINNVPAVIKKMRVSYPGVSDLQGLVDRVRLEVIMRRLE